MAGLQAFTAMIGGDAVWWPRNSRTGSNSRNCGGWSAGDRVGTALQGRAHDGIDSVPETGTRLQKGERVTTAKTSAPNWMPLWIE